MNFLTDNVYHICRNFIIFTLSILTCIKILNYKISKIFFVGAIILILFLSILYTYLESIPYIYFIFLVTVLISLYTFITTRKNISNIVATAIFSLVINHIIFWITGVILTVLFLCLNFNYFYLMAYLVLALQVMFFYIILSFNKINKIFKALSKRGIGIIVVIMSLAFFVIYSVLQGSNDSSILVVFCMLISCIIIWIIDSIKYSKNINDMENKLNKIAESNYKTSKINHKYSERISSLENSIQHLRNRKLNTEVSEEIAAVSDMIDKLAEDYDNETQGNITKDLQKTNIPSIDAMLEYQYSQAIKHKINFNFKIMGDINILIKNKIDIGKFETMIGDHIKNAIISVNNSSNSFKNILVSIENIDGCFKFSITDTGIPFEIDTLTKLGLEPITTYENSGGSGIGFMTTFETLKKCKASLVITEHNPNSKTLSIQFDDKNTYQIYSYRADKIRNTYKGDRIIIKNLY